MIKSIKFRYNKYKLGLLYILVIVFVGLGLLAYYTLLEFSGILKGPEFAPPYFREHSDHAIYLIFGLIPISMLLPAWIAVKLWTREEEEAELRFYEDYAVLYRHNSELRIERGGLSITVSKPYPRWYSSYLIKMPKQKIVLVSSAQEHRKNKGYLSTLDNAMYELSAYSNPNKNIEKEVIDFYGMSIILGETKPSIFNHSPYYVDYDSMVSIPDATFVSCMIRERSNPTHVVGDMAIDIRFLDSTELNEVELRQQPITEIIELNEEVVN